MAPQRKSRVEKEWLLILPLDRKGLHQSRQRERGRVLSIQDGVDNVGCQQRHPQDPADVGGVDLLRCGQLLDGPVPVSSSLRHRKARARALIIALSTRGRSAEGAVPTEANTSFRPPRFRIAKGTRTQTTSAARAGAPWSFTLLLAVVG